jgi:hypothetical protein
MLISVRNVSGTSLPSIHIDRNAQPHNTKRRCQNYKGVALEKFNTSFAVLQAHLAGYSATLVANMKTRNTASIYHAPFARRIPATRK